MAADMKKKEPTLHAYSVNYRARGDRGALVNQGFWIHNLPRILLACRILGHKAVVDGTEGSEWNNGYRWVCCDRCGLRTRPQLELDAAHWDIGDPYPDISATAWPPARGTFGGQLVLGQRRGTFGFSLKLGNCGSEHMLAGHVSLGWLGALYLHTEDFGTGIQRKVNPTGYQSRVIEAWIADAYLHWALWAKRDESSLGASRWRSGYVSVGVRDRLLGQVRYSYEVRAETSGTVRMPDGDDHQVELKLERQTRRRKRGRATHCWRADWSCRKGIPDGSHGSISASSVAVSDAAVEENRWAQEACAAIAAAISAQRTRRGWAPPAAPKADADR